MPTPAEIKKALREGGFEIYRTRGDVVHVAERVRENLLMESGIWVGVGRESPFAAASSIETRRVAVGFVVRAQRSDFPGVPDEQLLERARRIAARAVVRGYREVGTHVRDLLDPGDAERTLDTWCEVLFEVGVDSIDLALDEVRFLLSLEKAASPR